MVFFSEGDGYYFYLKLIEYDVSGVNLGGVNVVGCYLFWVVLMMFDVNLVGVNSTGRYVSGY